MGIDPGTATVGYALVDVSSKEPVILRHGAITTSKNWLSPRRLEKIYSEISDLIADFDPDCVCVEELFFYNNQQTAMAVSQARGVILLAAEVMKKPIYSYTPGQIKSAVCQSGKAKKREVQEGVAALFGLPTIPKPDDVADALATVWTHVSLTEAGQARLA